MALVGVAVALLLSLLVAPAAAEDRFSLRVVTTGLEAPWAMAWGPDSQLWVTEREGKRITRVNPANGSRVGAVVIADAFQDSDHQGVLGMALHPNLLRQTGEDFVYVAYVYAAGPRTVRVRIARYTYNASTQRLGGPVVVIGNLPASNDHNAGRLVIGPDRTLFYSIGDQGANKDHNKCTANRAMDLPTAAEVAAQNWAAYQGKILRLNLDGSIPPDNPTIAGVQSHVYSYGHRNAQGLSFGPDGRLYSSEHGPKTDDEINLIEPGRNYGWPRVAGYIDDKAYAYEDWSASAPAPCASLTYHPIRTPPSVPRLAESSFSDPSFTPPMKTFWTVESDYAFASPGCTGNGCYPSIAPSSIDVYPTPPATPAPPTARPAIPHWGPSLLVPSLKRGSVFRLRLSEDGTAIVGDAVEMWQTRNRYRAVAVHPDGRAFYVATDPGGANSGAILEFTYVAPP